MAGAGRAEIDSNKLRGVISHLRSVTAALEDLIPNACEVGLSNTEKTGYICRALNSPGAFTRAGRAAKKRGTKKGGA